MTFLNNICILTKENHHFLENEVLSQPKTASLRTTSTVSGALSVISKERMDAMILDAGTVEYSTVFQLMNQLKNLNLIAPPRTILWTGCKNSVIPEDLTVSFDSTENTCYQLFENLWKTPFPVLCNDSMEKRHAFSQEFADKLKMNQKLKGTILACMGGSVLSCYRRNDIPVTEFIYPQLAELQNKTCAAVERNIRTAIEHAWLKGSLEGMQELFGYSVDANRGKPTNAEFLYMMSNYIQKGLRHEGFV